MIDLYGYLEKNVKNAISAWEENDIYAISFFVDSNEAYEYKGYSNVTEFSISYNTENDCKGAGALSEERWNYAYWRQDTIPIIAAYDDDEGMELLFKWYEENGVENIGYEDPEACYDDEMQYIGKGPVGYKELLSEIIAVAKALKENGFIKNKFGRRIPVIIHDLEYVWYVIEATKEANPNGEADVFLKSLNKWLYSKS